MSEGCGWCKSKAGAVIDRLEKTAKCSECSYPVPIATTETKNASSDSVVPSDLGILQNPSAKYVSISQMSQRLSLREKVTNHANEIFKRISETNRNALVAACIFIACRQLHRTRSMEEISSVANGAKPSDISDAISVIAETLSIGKDMLMDIKPADFTTRFCEAVLVDKQAINVALEDAKRFDNKVNSNRSPATIAAAIAYHTALVYYERKLFSALIQTSGIAESAIKATLIELYPDPPKELTKAKDQKNLGST